MKTIKSSHLIKHESKRKALRKFLIILSIALAYMVVVSWRYGISSGWKISVLTWSFFVFSTPIADAGFLLDFPIRLLTKIRMMTSEIFVWLIAGVINLWFITYDPLIYNKTAITSIWKKILTTPMPYWGVVILSLFGTFLSIQFGDELLDVIKVKDCKKYKKYKHLHRLIILGSIFVGTFILYLYFIRRLGLEIL